MSYMTDQIAKLKAESESHTPEENLARLNAVTREIAERNAEAAAETKLYAYGLPTAFFGTTLLAETLAAKAAAAEFVGPPESIAGVGGVGIGGAGDVAAAAMENQVMTQAGGWVNTIGNIGKAIGGGIDTLATVIPKVGGIINTIEGVLGHEDQPTVDIRDNPAGDLPTSSAPVINLSIPPQSTGGIVLTTPAAEQPNTMLYVGLGILAIILLKGL